MDSTRPPMQPLDRSGEITFLFTDIERSTELLERLGDDQYAEMLAEHTRLLRAAIAPRGGREIAYHGDGVMVAFADARRAVEAAIDAQHTFAAHSWPANAPLRVRMGLHTGHPAVLVDVYVGLDVHRAARIGAAGHGGQILISEATRGLVEPMLPEGARLEDLGTHRLRDMKRPEKIFQVVTPTTPVSFPPLRSLSVLPNNLPAELTSFIGRAREIAEVKLVLASHRIVTLIGTGGCGKTRLALRVAAELAEEYRDGVWFVELASVSDPSLVPQTLAATVGVREQPGVTLIETLVETLTQKSLLLVLDNCEHLIPSASVLTEHLLKACPSVQVLATSRRPLGVAGESLWRVPSLPVPAPRPEPPLDSMARSDAILLFVERASTVQPAFSLTAKTARPVAEICHRLDGVPLAIEFAAARTRVLPVEEIEARLGDRFRLLRSGALTAPPRHQTLRAVLDWSHDLLSEQEGMLLRRLSAFAEGCTLDAAEAVCQGRGLAGDAVLDVLTGLVDHSLVIVEARAGATRYRMLDTVREYAKERLAASGEAEETRARHAGWFVRLAERAERELEGGAQAAWLERLAAELENIRLAIEWSLEDPERDAGLRIAGALQSFWYTRGFFSEDMKLLEATLARAAHAAAAVRGKAFLAAGFLALSLRDYDRSAQLTEEGRAACEEAGDWTRVARADARLGYAALEVGDHDRAQRHLEEALRRARAAGDRIGVRMSLNNLGELARCRNDYAAARAYYEEGLVVAREHGEERGIEILLGNLGFAVLHDGDCAQGTELFREMLQIGQRLGHKLDIAAGLRGLAQVAAGRGELERAARLLGAAEALLGDIGVQMYSADRLEYDRTIALVDAGLDPAIRGERWAEGRAMPLEQAIGYAGLGTDA